MILQSSSIVVGCPVCGRPMKMRSIYIGQEVRCSHCHGEVIVLETNKGTLKATNARGKNTMERAEQLLRRARQLDSFSSDCARSHPSPLTSESQAGLSETLRADPPTHPKGPNGRKRPVHLKVLERTVRSLPEEPETQGDFPSIASCWSIKMRCSHGLRPTSPNAESVLSSSNRRRNQRSCSTSASDLVGQKDRFFRVG